MYKIIIGGEQREVEITSEIINKIISAGEVYHSGVAQYNLILMEMKGKNVRFKDMRDYLLKEAREAGLYVSEDDLYRARTLPLVWYHKVDLFLGWVNRNFAGSYDKNRKSAGGAEQQEKAKAQVAVAPKKITKARLEKLYSDAENKREILDFVSTNLQDLVALLKSKPELLRALTDALEAEGLR